MKKTYFSVLLSFVFSTLTFASFQLHKLQVNYQTTPLGIDTKSPQFSWQMKAMDFKRGYVQHSYHIVVKDERNDTVWNSKVKVSDLSHAIQYKGNELKPATRYTWSIEVKNTFGEKAVATSWFETGLFGSSITAWSGAEWIGGGNDDLVLYAQYLSVFRIDFTIRLDDKTNSTKAGFIFGANDPRLLNSYSNFMAVQNKKNESYVEIELDISNLSEKEGGLALLNIYRVGYTSTDQAASPFLTLDIPASLINNNNKYDKHRIIAMCNFGVFDFYIDGLDAEHKIKDPHVQSSRFGPTGSNLNPVGAGNNFISFPMLNEIGFKTKEGQTAFFSKVAIKNFRHPANTLFTEKLTEGYKGIFKPYCMAIEDENYKITPNHFIVADPSKNAAPLLRTEFTSQNKWIKKARLYVTARGIYEFYINGKKAGNDYFNPGLTQYNSNHMYQTYDITHLIKSGQQNALGAWLSEGWWSGNITYSGEHWNYFGDRQSLLSKLVITYADGSEQLITSNDEDWKIFTDGPIRYGSFFQGEVYDGYKEAAIKHWNTVNFNDKNWKNASVVPLETTAFTGTIIDMFGRKSTLDYTDFKLIGQIGENAKVVKTLVSNSVEEVRPKVYVYDMGQNMVGIPNVHIRNGKKGQKITMRFAEVKYPNLPDYKGNEGMVMMENIRAALAQDIFILKGGDEIVEPRFTFHGYRYVEITGLETAIATADVRGKVISSVQSLASSYETSHPMVNKLWQNITWSLRGNFLSIPTDCPNRNERMGWSGDISVFAKSATYLTEANQFLKRHLLAMRDVQTPQGRFTDVAPMGGGFGGTLWGSAGITVAWETYNQYGDIQLLAEHYKAMKKYVLYLETKIDKSTGILNEGPLGDWLSPEGNKNDNTLFWMSYYAYDLEIVTKAAIILGNTDEATLFKNMRQEIIKTLNDVYIDKVTHRTIKSGMRTGFLPPPGESGVAPRSEKGDVMDTQASYAIPLALNVFNEENKSYAVKYLKESIERKNKDDGGIERPAYSLMTGFIGTASICEALSNNGVHDLAYKLLTQTEYPSWLYSVKNGATTIWERLNSYTVENGFGGNNSMNSFNHYSFGSIAAWMYQHSLGIQRGDKPAFKTVLIKPAFDPTGTIKSAKGYVETPYGKISSEWKTEPSRIVFTTTIPSNSQGFVFLPTDQINKIAEGGKSISTWKNVSSENGETKLVLGSGTYQFEIKK